MDEVRLGAVEARFADIVWQNAPIGSGELAKICEKELNWKRTTTYTVLKKLCLRGLFKNEGGVVSVLIDRDDYYAMEGESMLRRCFGGSLPRFLAAFTSRNELSEDEIAEIRRMIGSGDKEA